MKILASCLLLLIPFLATAQSNKTTSDVADEIYEFPIDKTRTNRLVSFTQDTNGWDVGHPLFSAIKGRNCQDKPARYIIVLVNSLNRPDFPIYKIIDVSNPKKWNVFREGAGGESLSSLIAQLRSHSELKDCP